ncbi:MAG: PhnD/SsuA/transferrin family substrate-binding protein [Lachnospiraceae bacterium]|nr:PhnD/SsuA/transferrin family substrate-binding protein [Lachnospiraceae bacterium]
MAAALLVLLLVLSGCRMQTINMDEPGAIGDTGAGHGLAETEELRVALVSGNGAVPEEEAWQLLEQRLIEACAGQEIGVSSVRFETGLSNAELVTALSEGSIDIALVPDTVAAQCEDRVLAVAHTTEEGIRIDPADPATWNPAGTHAGEEDRAAVQRHALILAGPSEKGRELADLVLRGQTIALADLEDAVWYVQDGTSDAGFRQPDAWFREQYGQGLELLPELEQAESYLEAFQMLAEEKADVITIPCDLRRTFAERWQSTQYAEDMARERPIFEETTVIGVTNGWYRDTVVLSREGCFAGALSEDPARCGDAVEQILTQLSEDDAVLALMEDAGITGFAPVSGE